MHHRQSTQSNQENIETAELAALRQLRSGRIKAVLAGASAIAFAMFAVGCPEPADLENPPAVGGTGSSTAGTSTAAGTGTTAGTGTGGSGGADLGALCEKDCVKYIFQTSTTGCKICHDDGTVLQSSKLDLKSNNFTGRLKDKPAHHLDGMVPNEMPLPAADMCPTGDLLIDSNNPDNSWLWKKVNKGFGTCGIAMPSAPLNPTDLACVKAYVECVAGKPLGGGTGGTGTGGTGTGGGGTTGGTGTGGTTGGTGGTTGGSGGTGGA